MDFYSSQVVPGKAVQLPRKGQKQAKSTALQMAVALLCKYPILFILTAQKRKVKYGVIIDNRSQEQKIRHSDKNASKVFKEYLP